MSRYRSEGQPPVSSAVPFHFTGVDFGAVSHIDFAMTYLGSGEFTTMVDEVTPNFRKRMNSGELIINPMVKTYVKRLASGGSSFSCTVPDHTWTITSGGNTTAGFIERPGMGGPSYPPPKPTVLSDEAMVREALAKIDPTQFAFMEDVLSLKQVVQTFTTFVQTASKIFQKMIDRAAITSISDAWLTYRFELFPLYNSLVDAINGYLKKANQRNEAKIRLRATAISIADDSLSGSFLNANGTVRYTVADSRTTSKRCVVYYRLQSPRAGFAQTYGLRFKDLPGGLWNVVTLSFMIDRIYDISSFIKSLMNSLDCNIVLEGACITEKTSVLQQYTCTDHYESASVHYIVGCPGVQIITLTTSRRRVNPSGIGYRVDLLPFDPNGLTSSLSRALDLLALIFSGLGRFVKPIRNL